TYLPERDAQRFDHAIAAQRGGAGDDVAELGLVSLDLRPFPYQQEILERLEVEREVHGRWKNLVVAATGTGKTMIAAFDYARLRQQWGHGGTRLLFVAHRDHILKQSLHRFRLVLGEAQFGTLWTGGRAREGERHLFASIQGISAQGVESLDPSAFDVLIVDEFHHAAAKTYRRLLEHLQPRVLVGLTATPERTDGQSVLAWFDGRIAAELRLWHALDRQLLVPFQYFGIKDEVALDRLRWTRGHYDADELDRVYTGNHERVRLVLRALRQHVLHLGAMRAIGFCVSVQHARFMAEQFQKHGIPAGVVTGDVTGDDREAAISALRARQVNVLFTVDVLGEGVDIPEVDTVLLLRPTESATVFQQQLGRGLRLAPGKSCLTVLDFIGAANKSFRFDLRYASLVSGGRAEIRR
ncbi:MAG: DEAD/DEAH box helicase, partial [Proteobacteria bacterium]|nr:DEAD/DEAH box helicase [Pseudomonadota bacterium]